ncbi:MAG: NAD-dependent epimerase/dehydratase family protein [Myxococcota bacterium]
MRVLITGAGGFVGRWLRRELERTGAEVVGADRAGAEQRLDVTDARAVDALVAAVRPSAVVHLAAMASVAECSAAPAEAFAVNAGGTLNVAQALLRAGSPCRLLLVSSGEVYGSSAGIVACREDQPVDPVSVYGATKRAAEVVALQARHLGLDVVIARPFNHIGAGQGVRFALPAFARQLASAPRGVPLVLEVGNLSAVRDFSHVADVVDGYRVLLERGVSGAIYNLGSGVGRSVEQMLGLLVELSGREVTVQVDPSRLRPVEIPTLIADPSRLLALGWRPSRPVEQALRELLAEAQRAASNC